MLTLYLICFVTSVILLGAPTAAAILSRPAQIPSILTFAFFVVLQQLLFALGAAVFSSYTFSFPLAATVVVAVGLRLNRQAEISTVDKHPLAARSYTDYLPWIIFSLVFVSYCAIRAQYSYINFNNNGDEAGVEKLFNLSLQQSFLYGHSYPPQWIWLAGEPIRYYIFLKSIPGLASWIARVLFTNAQTGGVFFILSEAFFAALTPAVVCGWILRFGRGAKQQVVVGALATLLALFCCLSAHFQAVSLGLSALVHGTNLDWWQLSREVIPYTDNQYPVWFMILGDSHAYMQVYFLQALFWGAFLCVVVLDRFSPIKAAALAVLAAALLLTHPGSVLVDLSFLATFIAVFVCYYAARADWARIRVALAHAATTLVTAALPLCFLYEPAGQVKFSVPAAELASPLLSFINLNFSVLVWVALIVAHPAIRRRLLEVLRKHSTTSREWIVTLTIIFAISYYLLNRPALALMVVLASLTYLFLFDTRSSETEKILCMFALSAFSVWLLPEIIAFDHTIDSRTTWIRFQMSLRFWPEGYVLIPFAITVAVVNRIGNLDVSRSWIGATAIVIALLFASHIPGVTNRLSRSRQAHSSLDGFAEFKARFPVDSEIVTYLQTLPPNPRVVIAESCGIGDPRVPVDFAWPGRIAAFSGRSGVCGWARHAMLYNNPLRQVGFKDTLVEERTAEYLKTYLGLFSALSNGDTAQAQIEVGVLKGLGVSHIIFGQFEKGFFPNYSIENTAPSLPLKVVFKAADGMGVLSINE